MHNTVQKTGVGRAYACSGGDSGAASQEGERYVAVPANPFFNRNRGQSENDAFFYFRPSEYCEMAIFATIRAVVS